MLLGAYIYIWNGTVDHEKCYSVVNVRKNTFIFKVKYTDVFIEAIEFIVKTKI